ncbi:MAG: hypothetical protein HYY24_13190 [Verrucomicrobia bacterium]|nr:hypothetical protein [Verrucomicrobiota bacterium]
MSAAPQLGAAPGWETVACVVERNTRDLLSKRFSLHGEVVSWFKSLALFREAETERLIMRDPTPEDLRWHRAIIAALIADGERLSQEWERIGVELVSPDRIKHADLAAAVAGLYSTQSMWGSDLTKEQRREIIRSVFGVDPTELTFGDSLPAAAAS